MCKFTSTMILQEVFHNCVHPQEVANKKTPWSQLPRIKLILMKLEELTIANRFAIKKNATRAANLITVVYPSKII